MKASFTTHANVIWSVNENLSTGLEYMYGRRTNTDGRYGTAQRIQAMVKYAF